MAFAWPIQVEELLLYFDSFKFTIVRRVPCISRIFEDFIAFIGVRGAGYLSTRVARTTLFILWFISSPFAVFWIIILFKVVLKGKIIECCFQLTILHQRKSYSIIWNRRITMTSFAGKNVRIASGRGFSMKVSTGIPSPRAITLDPELILVTFL